MTKVLVNRQVPIPIPSARFSQNNDVPSQTALRRIARGYNHVAVNQRKVVHVASYDTQSTYAPVSSNETTSYFSFRTGENVEEIAILAGMAPASAANGAFRAFIELGIYDGTTTTVSPWLYYPKVQAGNFQPSEVGMLWTKISVADGLLANTDYCGFIRQVNYARLHYVTVYERAKRIAVSGVDGVCNPLAWESNKPILDDSVQDVCETGTLLWKHNARQILSISREDSTTAFTVTGTTNKNIHSSATAWSASAPGYVIDTEYHNTQKGTVPIEIAARIRRTAGSGDLIISFVQNGLTILTKTFSGTSTTPHAITSGVIPAASAAKTDVLIRCSDGSTYEIDCIGLWEYEA